MPATTSMRLAAKRSLRDMELAAANKACASLSNKSFRLEAEYNDQRRIKVNVVTKEPVLLARMAGKTVVCSIVLDDQQLHASPDESKMDIDAVSITGTDDDAVIVDSSVKEYCDDVNDGEASTSTVEVIPDELDIDEELLAEEMTISILSALPLNPSDLAIKGAKILKRSLQKLIQAAPRIIITPD